MNMNKEVKLEIENKKGYFYIKPQGKMVAEMTFDLTANNEMIINHTEVKESFSGKGLGKILIEKAVAYARENKLKIIPLCSFAKRVLENSTKYNDVL